jgi:hypothetical protein
MEDQKQIRIKQQDSPGAYNAFTVDFHTEAGNDFHVGMYRDLPRARHEALLESAKREGAPVVEDLSSWRK